MPDMGVFIARAQPPHLGHLHVVREGLKSVTRMAIILGSANEPRNPRNPFSYQERELMFRSALTADENQRVVFLQVEDSDYNLTQWLGDVQAAAAFAPVMMGVLDQVKTFALVGHRKDHTSYYQSLFPQWATVEVSNYEGISATDIREKYFSADSVILADMLPESVVRWLEEFRQTEDFASMVEEQDFVRKYRQSWEAAPYKPTFVTTDACVVQSGMVLLVKRKAAPGRGLWALPGGFLEQNELVIDGIIRELKEETSIRVPTAVLKGSMVGPPTVFDAPYRSLRGRTITHAGLFILPPGPLPKVRAADDAAAVKWWPISDIRREMMFEDHKAIIANLTGRI